MHIRFSLDNWSFYYLVFGSLSVIFPRLEGQLHCPHLDELQGVSGWGGGGGINGRFISQFRCVQMTTMTLKIHPSTSTSL